MSSAKISRRWASSANFSTSPTGGVNGTPTKADPGSAVGAEGFVPGLPGNPRHVNFELNEIIDNQRHNVKLAALQLRKTDYVAANTTAGMGAIRLGTRGHSTIVLRHGAGGNLRLGDCGPTEAGGDFSAISQTFSAARKPSGRLVVVGVSAQRNEYSDDDGDTWTAGVALGGTGLDVVFNSTYSRFICTQLGTVSFASDPSAAWTNVVVSNVGASTLSSGIAVLPNGDTLILASATDTPATFSISANGGTSWSVAAGAPSSPSSYTERGYITGNDGVAAYHAGILTGAGTLRVSTTTTGTTWTSVATLVSPSGRTFAGRSRIRQCADTGLLVVSCVLDDGTLVMYCSTDGTNWSDSVIFGVATKAAAIQNLAIANGQVFVIDADKVLWKSDGIGS